MINSAQRLEYLRAMGVDVWVRRSAAEHRDAGLVIRDSSESEPVPSPESRVPRLGAMEWPALTAAVKSCTQCALHRSRTQTVFGVGNQQAQWMIIGEAPGADEDKQGEPFVCAAGQLLNAMLKAMNLAREQVFITNVMKCRPPGDRDPTPAEVACCKPFLQRQIELVNPSLILCMGRIAAQNLLDTDTPIEKMRGQVHRVGEVQRPVVVTYHPAHLLRSPGDKRRAWADLQLAMATMEKTVGRRL